MKNCRYCGSEGHSSILHATERMFGWGGEFSYSQCQECGSLGLINIPDDLGAFYPPDYYAYQPRRYPEMKGFARRVKRWLCHHYYQRFNPIIAPLSTSFPKYLKWLPRGAVGFDEPILDVGCGAGNTLAMLAHEGFTNLTGVDPFLSSTVSGEKFHLEKCELSEHVGCYKLVYSLHVFEHVLDPADFFRQVRRLLADDGMCIVATPNPASLARHYYKQFWFALDPPRHLHLVSPDAFQKMAEEAGLSVVSWVSDSTGSQFWGSETYLRGENWESLRTFSGYRGALTELATKVLNFLKYGDSACYYLKKASSIQHVAHGQLAARFDIE